MTFLAILARKLANLYKIHDYLWYLAVIEIR